jgi:hypothetical protein
MSAAGRTQKLAGKAPAKAGAKIAAAPKHAPGNGGNPPGAQRASPFGIVTILFVAACLLGLSPPSFIILVIGMAPTVISYLFETGSARGALPCMVALNIGGVAPVLSMLWGRSNSISSAYALLSDPYIWLLMYGSAGGAFALLWMMPRVAQVVIDSNARGQRAKLAAEQEKLVAEWGAEVAQAGAAPAPAKPRPAQ